VLFDAQMQAQADERTELAVAVAAGVELEQFVLYYQPLVRLQDGSVEGYEALVRWNRPGYGLVAPGEFIPIAERTRLITEIGHWVVNEACREAAGWADETLGVSVNLSAKELAQDDVVGSVVDALRRSGLAPSRLTVELTESTMLEAADAAGTNLARLLGLGVTIAIDDFGTGYSSLSHLREVPASILKIDRCFIRDLDTSATGAEIVGAIVTMAHALGLKVVAEGIERPAQAELVRSLGCDAGQGFLLGRPLPAGEIAVAVALPPVVAGR
jgi:diguanylate cyclase